MEAAGGAGAAVAEESLSTGVGAAVSEDVREAAGHAVIEGVVAVVVAVAAGGAILSSQPAEDLMPTARSPQVPPLRVRRAPALSPRCRRHHHHHHRVLPRYQVLQQRLQAPVSRSQSRKSRKRRPRRKENPREFPTLKMATPIPGLPSGRTSVAKQ